MKMGAQIKRNSEEKSIASLLSRSGEITRSEFVEIVESVKKKFDVVHIVRNAYYPTISIVATGGRHIATYRKLKNGRYIREY